MRPLPKSPNEITPQWMTAVLRNSGSLPASAEVSEVTGRQLGEGAGMLSELSLLSLTYSGDYQDAPATLVAKFPTLNEVNRGIAMDFRVYQREVRSYQEIVPKSRCEPQSAPRRH